MLQRAIFLYGLFVVAVLSTGVAVWQSLETNLREEQLSDATQLLTAARNEARTFKDKAQLAERRVRVLESAEAKQSPSDELASAITAKLRAELAAARQQLAAAETAMRETEDRLAGEIADHAELKAKAQELTDEVAAAGRAIAAAEAKAATDAQPGTKPLGSAAAGADAATSGATGSLPDAPVAGADTPPVAELPAVEEKRAPARKSPPRRASKPIIKAVEPLGAIEPML